MKLYSRLAGAFAKPEAVHEPDRGAMTAEARHAAEQRPKPALGCCAYIRLSRHGQIVGSAFSKMADHIGLELVAADRVSERPALLMFWLPKLMARGGAITARAERAAARLLKRYPGLPTINRSFAGNAKTLVGTAFRQSFGYGISVDPTSFSGLAVEKSDRNATHDGVVVRCPIDGTAEGKVYQRLVDNRTDGKTVCDMRVPIVGRRIPFVYLKYRQLRDRFDHPEYAELVATRDVLAPAETDALLRFASTVQMEYGELDVLRDQGSRRIYVVDANNTPLGPPKNIRAADGKIAIRLLATAFHDEFVSAESTWDCRRR